MPQYEYECKKCNKVLSRHFHIIENIENIECKCGGEARKIISSSTFILKGSGWYIDGYSKEKK